jgi:hypothetical protein
MPRKKRFKKYNKTQLLLVLCLSLVVLSVVSLALKFFKKESPLDVFVTVPYSMTVALSADSTSLNLNQETTIRLRVSGISGATSVASRGVMFAINIPNNLTVTDVPSYNSTNQNCGTPRTINTGGVTTGIAVNQVCLYSDSTNGTRVGIVAATEPGVSIPLTNNMEIFTFKVRSASAGTYALTFKNDASFKNSVLVDYSGELGEVLTQTFNTVNLTVTQPTVANPTFSPDGGTHNDTVSVTLSTATSGSTIRYTVNGSTPSPTTGTIYSAPFTINTTGANTVRAIAYQTGYANSAVVSKVFTINNAPTVSITSPTAGADITIGSTPTILANLNDPNGLGDVRRVVYRRNITGSTAFTTICDKNKNIDANAVLNSCEWSTSGLTAGTYQLTAVATDANGLSTTSSSVSVDLISSNQAPTVSITSPSSNAEFTAPANVTVQATASDPDTGDTLRVEFIKTRNGTTDTTPTCNDTTSPYSCVFSNLTAGNYTFTARVIDNRGGENTDSVSVVVRDKVATPTFNPAAGTFSGPVSVTISSTTSGVTIKYTRDGTDPRTSSTAITATGSATVTLNNNTRLRAYATRSGFIDSDTATADYVVNIAPEDVNGDRVINLTDVAALVDRLITLEDRPNHNYDVDRDNDVDLVDLIKVIDKYLLGN